MIYPLPLWLSDQYNNCHFEEKQYFYKSQLSYSYKQLFIMLIIHVYFYVPYEKCQQTGENN